MRKRPRKTQINKKIIDEVFGTSYQKELLILKIIDDYNHFMSRVDITDQLRSYYNTQIKALRTWLPLFFWLLQSGRFPNSEILNIVIISILEISDI